MYEGEFNLDGIFNLTGDLGLVLFCSCPAFPLFFWLLFLVFFIFGK